MNYTISVVDDEEMSERILTSILKIEGYDVIPAANGKLALAQFETKIPDLILLDIDMPEMNGLELISIIKSRPELKDIPVIFISAHMDLDTKVEGLHLGGIDFISKPFQNAEVISRVRVHLENSLLQKQLRELNNKKNKFFSIIARDMKGNLDEIFARIQMLSDYVKVNDIKTLKESLTGIIKYNNQTRAYLRNLIYWSRLETNLVTINPTVVHVNKVIKETLKEYEGTIETKKISLQNSFDSDDCKVLVDEYAFRIIIDNLLSNAVKFTNYHEYIQISHNIDNNSVKISFLNKGMFFTAALQKKVFNFEQHSDEPLDEEDKGSGLGLALCKELIEKNNGKFSLHANGNITEIKFSLPLFVS